MSALTEQELHPRVNSMTVDRGRGRGNRPHRHESILIGVALQSAWLEPSRPDTGLVGNGKLSRTDP